MGVKAVPSAEFRVLSSIRLIVWGALVFVISGCMGARSGEISRVALLAPFEGRYREVGYNALYAAKLALQDWNSTNVELVAIDDGGTAASAVDRARALAQDPLVKAVVVLGYAATDAETQRALGDVPVLVVGHWGARPETENVFVLANSALGDSLTTSSRLEVTDGAQLDAPLNGGEIFALEQFARLRPSVDGIRILSSGTLPDAAFTERYNQTGLFVPAPGLLATLTYDAFGMILTAQESTDANISSTMAQLTYTGINGTIRFENGYWVNAPVNQYEYDRECVRRGGKMCLVPVDS